MKKAIDKAKVQKEIEREAHARRRKLVAELGRELAEARRRKTAATRAAKTVCRARRVEAGARVKEMRAAAKLATSESADRIRADARNTCDAVTTGARSIAFEIAELERRQREAEFGKLAPLDVDEPAPLEHAFADMIVANPSREFVLLGRLTRLAYRTKRQLARTPPKVLIWSYRQAPLLAYDARGRLHVVYSERKAGRASERAEEEYARSHWGASGGGRLVEGAEVRGPFTASERMGLSTSVTYTTKKGEDPELTDYEHAWGEGSLGRFVPPTVCQSHGRVALVGGTYRVTDRGIVG